MKQQNRDTQREEDEEKEYIHTQNTDLHFSEFARNVVLLFLLASISFPIGCTHESIDADCCWSWRHILWLPLKCPLVCWVQACIGHAAFVTVLPLPSTSVPAYISVCLCTDKMSCKLRIQRLPCHTLLFNC